MLLVALRSILDSRRLITRAGKSPLMLVERNPTSRCPPVPIRSEREHWALRPDDSDFLPLLAELPTAESVRRLPDFLLFSATDDPPAHRNAPTLRVLVCELKSSATGVESALPQIRLGRLLAEYLLKLAAYRLGTAKPPVADYSGLIVSPELPTSLVSKGRTRPGRVEHHCVFDALAEMQIYTVPADVDVWLNTLY